MTAETPETAMSPEGRHLCNDGAGGIWSHPGRREDCRMPECVVPQELVDLALADAHPGCQDDARAYLAAVLPAHEAMVRAEVHAELFGTPEEIRQRAATARTPDDTAEICERLAPGHHEQRVRAKVAEENAAKITETREMWSDTEPEGPNPCDAADEHNCHRVAGELAFAASVRIVLMARGEQP